jgi:FkbM family methyltransferase
MSNTGRTHIEHEIQNILAIVHTLDDGSIIIDGGANIGFFTIPVAQFMRERNCKIISFEPQKQLFYALGGSVALNLHNLGIGDKQSIAELSEMDYSKKADYGMVTLTEKSNHIEVPYLRYNSADVITIDSMELPGCDFVKLDIEGYECQALRGAIDTIEKYRPWIWIEYNMAGEDNIKAELKNISDYEYIIIDWQNMLCAPKERIEASGIDFK